ncbi:MAG: aldolase/citrate lyase family protein [Patescibacteria group bacterium]|nr:aldolase/citrate lyase family protein [Patescibacteria group bacterium]
MNTQAIRHFRTLLDRRAVWGPFSKTADPAMVEAIGHAGADFIILDMEHGPCSLRDLEHLIRAAEVAGMLPIVRVPEQGWQMVGAALDLGAGGVQMPQVRTADDAERLIRHARFAPAGDRGVCRHVRAAGYSSLDKQEYFAAANEAVLVAQLEGKEALANLDAILAVPGLDVVFVGPYDLSQSLGVPGQVQHAAVVEAVADIVRRAGEAGMLAGTFVETMEQAAFWREQGVRYVSYGVDISLLYGCVHGLVEQFRGHDGKMPLAGMHAGRKVRQDVG